MNAKALFEIIHSIGLFIIWGMVGIVVAKLIIAVENIAESLAKIARIMYRTEDAVKDLSYHASEISTQKKN